MGDRAHLLSKDITIDTFVEDLVQVIESEELTKIVLVGHSFGGVPISGLADRLPERIAHLVYLDSVVVESGKSAFSYYPQAEAEARRPLRRPLTVWRSRCRSHCPPLGVWGRKAIQSLPGAPISTRQ
jgi:pimeloyl-ACP methyl ester carboxylesterase